MARGYYISRHGYIPMPLSHPDHPDHQVYLNRCDRWLIVAMIILIWGFWLADMGVWSAIYKLIPLYVIDVAFKIFQLAVAFAIVVICLWAVLYIGCKVYDAIMEFWHWLKGE